MELFRVLGIDFGTKRIGVAVSDPMRITAQGLCIISRVGKKKDIPAIIKLIDEHEAKLIIMGLPKGLAGGEGTLQQSVEKFGRLLESKSGIPVRYHDERLTTVQAEKVLLAADVSRLKRVKVIDKMAAQLMLQNWLDNPDTPKT